MRVDEGLERAEDFIALHDGRADLNDRVMERGQAGRFQIERDVFPVKGEILLAVDGDAVVDVVDVVALAALQKGIALGDLILGCGAIRDDGASKAYVHPEYPAVADYQLLGLCVDAAKALGCPYHVGIIHSHESFYHEENDAESAYWSRKGALGADMESAALFTIGRLRGMKTASILNNVVVYGEDTANAIGGYVNGESLTAIGERNEILTALEAEERPV